MLSVLWKALRDISRWLGLLVGSVGSSMQLGCSNLEAPKTTRQKDPTSHGFWNPPSLGQDPSVCVVFRAPKIVLARPDHNCRSHSVIGLPGYLLLTISSTTFLMKEVPGSHPTKYQATSKFPGCASPGLWFYTRRVVKEEAGG